MASAQVALLPVQRASLGTLGNVVNNLLVNIKPLLDKHNVPWNAAGGWTNTIQQSWLDADPSLNGLTVAQVQSALNVLFAVINPAIANNLAALAQLAVDTGN